MWRGDDNRHLHPADDRSNPGRVKVGHVRFSRLNRTQLGFGLYFLIVLPWIATTSPGDERVPIRLSANAPASQVLGFAFSPDGQTIATTQNDRRVALRSLERGGKIVRLLDCLLDAWTVVFSPDGRYLALGADRSDVMLCDLSRGGQVRPMGSSIRRVTSLAFSPDCTILAAGGDHTNDILLWDIPGSRPYLTLRGHGSRVLQLAFAPDGRTLFSSATTDSEILAWDVTTGQARLRISVHSAAVRSLACSPDGARLAAVCGRDRQILVWDLNSGRCEQGFGELLGTSRIAFALDGKSLATADCDGKIRLRNVSTGRERFSLDSPVNWIQGLGFSPDGRTLAAVGVDGHICLWDLSDLIASRLPSELLSTDRGWAHAQSAPAVPHERVVSVCPEEEPGA